MTFTKYQAAYYAHTLTRRFPPDSVEKLTVAFAGAQVDLNPHQIDAALFAFKSPLSKGALIADEVGLGKTIEAGLVLSQKWAERKKRILIITPSNLRKQWFQELNEKFFLPCRILESKPYNKSLKEGQTQPFDIPEIVICSFHFAKNKAADVQKIPWDLVVIDEAHRLRNVYKPSNVIGNTLKNALFGKNKLLLTATPLQNSLLELYGLVSFIDEHAFGDLKSFREQFSNLRQEQIFHMLKMRLKPICHRTLRHQVMPYIKYTQRLSIAESFTPHESEDRLYNLVSNYLQRKNLHALPSGQRSLMTLVLRKLLASSTFAIAGALTSMANRLKAKLNKVTDNGTLVDDLENDYEGFDDTSDEWGDDDENDIMSHEDIKALDQEIRDLDEFTNLAVSIKQNAKGTALIKALNIAFDKARGINAERKAIIFTESRKTQDYLLRLLSDSEFSEGIVLFNGQNNDERSKKIYNEWKEKHKDTDRFTGSRTADMRSAIVDYFREQGQIMIATEAGAEGINLQFCSLVVNYDLPWNPQRIEQRIGRCHRYGQKHDVVVVNFINKKNAADQRVFQLLSEKFKLFEGVFGASDEVLGAIESGVDFEKRIVSIYQQCRKPEEIQFAFDQLQLELSREINEAMTRTRQQLIDNFDDEVREKLKIHDEKSKTYLNKFEDMLMKLTRYELDEHASFENNSVFRLLAHPFPKEKDSIPLGLYELPRLSGEAHLYRFNHPLAEAIVKRAKSRPLPPAELWFDYEKHEGKVSILETLIGYSGWLKVYVFSVESMDQGEDHILLAGMTDDHQLMDEETTTRLLSLPSVEQDNMSVMTFDISILDKFTRDRQAEILKDVSERNARFFEEEADKLDAWADDLKIGLEREIKEIDRQIKEARRASMAALTLQEKLAGQKQIKTLEGQRNQKRRSLFDAQDNVDIQRENLIENIERKLQQKTSLTPLFQIRWRLK